MMSHRTWFYKIVTCLFRLWPFDHKHGGHQQPLEKGLLLNTPPKRGSHSEEAEKTSSNSDSPKGDRIQIIQGKATPEKHTSGVWKWWTFQQCAPVLATDVGDTATSTNWLFCRDWEFLDFLGFFLISMKECGETRGNNHWPKRDLDA